MKLGASISGGLHTALLVAALWGVDWFSEQEDLPLTVTEIEMVDGTDFEAALSTAPVVESEGPDLLKPPSEGEGAPQEISQPADATDIAPQPQLAEAPPPDPKPEQPDIQIPPPPTDIPTEAPKISIAEIPSPDPLDNQATEPESPPSTEPVQPLASLQMPLPSSKPTPPPQPEPEPEPVEAEPDPQPTEPDPTETAEPKPQPEPTEQPEPEVAEAAQPDAPEGPAPQEARLPLAKPADLAAAAAAARKARIASQQEADQQQTQQQTAQATQRQPQPQPSTSGGSPRKQARPLSNGEKNALRLGIGKYYVYNGTDPNLSVLIQVQLDQNGKVKGKPKLVRAKGGDKRAQTAIYNAGRRAVLRAAAAGEFKKLPREKYDRWKKINVIFTARGVGLGS